MFFFFNDTATTEIYTLSLHDALPIYTSLILTMTKNDNGYVALIADAVASRTLAPRARARLQSDVRASLGDLNRRWRRAIAAKFAVTRGDEIRSEEHTSELQSRLHLVC